MPAIEHPSTFIDKYLTDSIREKARDAEGLRKLHTDQLDIIYKQKWFKMFVPKQYGGLAMSLPEILKIEEGLSWTDGSTAWVVTLCSGAGWFVGFLEDVIAKEIFNDEHACLAGSGAVSGTASIIASGGYEVTGKWKYASGSLHATAFTANCHIQKNGHLLYNDDGSPIIKSFLLKKEEVKVNSTWNGMGMIATGTNSFEADHVAVSESRCFLIDGAQTILKDQLYKFPFLQLAETTLAVNMTGMALRFIDLTHAILSQKEKQQSDRMKTLFSAQLKLNDLRSTFYKNVDTAWNHLIAEGNLPEPMLKKVGEASQILAYTSRQIVNELYPFCGLAAADTGSEINRVWRNIHTAGQHSLFAING